MSLLNVPFELSQMRTNDGRSIYVFNIEKQTENKKQHTHTE